MKSFKLLITALILCAFFQFSTQAQTKTWIGASGGSWGNANNWSPMGVPGSQDVIIPSGSEVNVDVTAFLDSLTVQSGAVVNKTTDLAITMTNGVFETGSTLNFFGGNINSAGGTGGEKVFNGTVNIIGPERKRFGGDVIINNVMNVESGVIDFDLRSNTLLISQGAVMTVGDGSIKVEAFTATLRNEGLIQKTSGAGTFTIDTVFENDGAVINIENGSMDITGSSVITDSEINVNSNGFFRLFDNVNHTLNGTLTGQLDGPFIINSNQFRVTNNANNFLDFSGPAGVEWIGGTLSAQGSPGTVLVNKGLLTVKSTGSNSQMSGGVVFRNEGEMNFENTVTNFSINQSSVFENAEIGIITVLDGMNITDLGVVNNGLLQKISGTGDATISRLINNESGIVSINSGRLILNVSYQGNGVITGEGTLVPVPASTDITGTIVPGINGVGTLNYLNQTEFDSTPDCIYQLELNGANPDTEHDVFAINTNAKLNGSFDIQLGFAPQLNDEFVVITADNITECNLPAQTSGFFGGMEYTYDVVCNADNVTLKVVEITLGIKDSVLASSKVFPNPTNGNFTIKLSNNISEINTSITNILGQVVASERFTNTDTLELDLQGSPGIYFVALRSAEDVVKIIKVVKH